MILLIFCIYVCNLSFLLLPLVITTNLPLGLSFGLLNATSIHFIMPVIIRSQAKVSISPNNVLLILSQNTTSIGSNDGPSMPRPLLIGPNNRLSLTIPDTMTIDYSLDPPSSSLLVPSSMDVPNSTGDTFNLKFSNSCPFENSEAPQFCSSVSHNSSVLKLSNMEADFEDLLVTPSKDKMDINDLFTYISSQMSTHMDHLQAQLMMTDTNVSQAQDSFKQEVRAELDELWKLIATRKSPTVNTTTVKSPPVPSLIASNSTFAVSNLGSRSQVSPPSAVQHTGMSSSDV
jgi:hypothetical protein